MAVVIPETPADFDHTRIIERPDGFYWQDTHTESEYGPFPSLLEAVADMEFSDAGDFESGETLTEAEREVGVAEWIDPETGAPAENGAPRVEDH